MGTDPVSEVWCFIFYFLFISLLKTLGYAVAQLVEALLYKAEGRGFDSRCGHWDFSLI
jgi:hypothetical protein